jgi:4-carboxymuconolactone decarboxylase
MSPFTRLFSLAILATVSGLIGPANAQTPATRQLNLVGDRFKPLIYEQMTAEQKFLTENLLSGERRGLGGPFNVLLRSPEMGDLAQKFGAYFRFHSSVPSKLNELAIIMTARYWTAQFEWTAHHRAALQAGLSPAVADAIAAGKRPTAMDKDVEVVYNFCDELLKTKQVSDATFQAIQSAMGEQQIVDLIGVMGYYQLVSMLLNVDRYPLAAGTQPELKPLE